MTMADWRNDIAILNARMSKPCAFSNDHCRSCPRLITDPDVRFDPEAAEFRCEDEA